MDAGQFETIVDLLVEIRDRLPEKPEVKAPESITGIMTDAIRLEKVRSLVDLWANSSVPTLQDCGRAILVVLNSGK